MKEIPVGKGEKLKDGENLAVLTLGPIAYEAGKAIEQAEKEAQERGEKLTVAHYDMRFLKPIDTEILEEVAQRFTHVMTLEDGVISGGLGSAVLEYMADKGYALKVKRLGLPDEFVEHGSVEQLYQIVGLDSNSIAREIIQFVKH